MEFAKQLSHKCVSGWSKT